MANEPGDAAALITAMRGVCGPVVFDAFARHPDRCYFFPVEAPHRFIEPTRPPKASANTLELPRRLRREDMDFEKGVGSEARITVLPLCITPRALLRAGDARSGGPTWRGSCVGRLSPRGLAASA